MKKRIILPVLLILTILGSIFPSSSVLAVEAISVWPASGKVGSTVNVYGTGYTAGSPYNVFLGITLVKSGIVAAGSTTISDSFAVPQYPGGSAAVTVQTAAGSAVATFLVAPNCTSSVSSGAKGQQVTLSGDGFAASRSVTVTFGTVNVATATTTANGAFTAVFNVPESPGGTHPVTATDANGTSYATSFLITPKVTVSSGSGMVGSEINIQGTGLLAITAVTLTLDDSPVVTVPATITSNAVGSFNAAFKVPSSGGGAHQLVATDGSHQVPVDFTITASLGVSPGSAGVGQDIQINGVGFGANGTVNIYLGDTRVKDVFADSEGSFVTKLVVPPLAGGTHLVRATDGTNNVTAELAVSVSASISAVSGYIGTAVTISGTGFSGTVVTRFDGAEISRKAAQANGSFSVTFNIPASKAGNHVITTSDGRNTISEDFTVLVDAALNQTTGSSGIPVTMSGSGFTGTVIIGFDGKEIARTNASTGGAFSVTFSIPAARTGNHVVSASDGHNTISEDFTVLIDAALNQTAGPVGMPVTISGSGFTGTVVIGFDGTEIARTSADTGGKFSITFTVPAAKAGNHNIVATDGTNASESVFAIEANPPAAPKLLSPASAAKAPTKAVFEWESVTDPSGVSYVLQVATGGTFTAESTILQKTNLTNPTYTLTVAEKLEATGKDEPYYWRVKAVDGALNESDWTTASPFLVGFSLSGFPIWAVVLLIVIGVLLVLFIGIWLGRRSAYY